MKVADLEGVLADFPADADVCVELPEHPPYVLHPEPTWIGERKLEGSAERVIFRVVMET